MSTSKKLLTMVLWSAISSVLMVSTPSHAAKLSDSKPGKMFAFELNIDDVDEQHTEKSAPNDDGKKRVIRREMIINREPMEIMGNGAQIVRIGEKTVKNAPYSAEVISEKQQKLADGNVIASKVTSLTYRDSQGRTREEIRDAKGEVREIIIHDPSEGRLILNPKNKTATKLMTSFQFKDGVKTPLNVITENISKSADGKDVIELKLAGEGDKQGERHVVVRRIDRNVDAKVNSGELTKTLTVDVRGPEMGRNIEMHIGNPMLDSGFSRIFSDAKWSAKRQTKALGSREFDGIKAEGKMTSFEIPAGEIGNTNPILVTDESWTSAELQITVYSKHSDPRSGDRIYRLNNVKREEAPASMFAIPSDYKVRDLSKDITKGMKLEWNDKAEKAQKIEREIKIEKK
nr:hypothetical protein [uncultured Undibacterium sp.]